MSKRDELMKYLSLTPWNTNPAILNEKIDEIVNEEGGSGGESSEFSTADVTFSSLNGHYVVVLPYIDSDFMAITTAFHIWADGETTVKIPLYKGRAILVPDNILVNTDTSIEPVITGDIELNWEMEGYVVTGDGSMAFAGT